MESKAPVQKKKKSRVWLWVLIAVVVTIVVVLLLLNSAIKRAAEPVYTAYTIRLRRPNNGILSCFRFII